MYPYRLAVLHNYSTNKLIRHPVHALPAAVQVLIYNAFNVLKEIFCVDRRGERDFRRNEIMKIIHVILRADFTTDYISVCLRLPNVSDFERKKKYHYHLESLLFQKVTACEEKKSAWGQRVWDLFMDDNKS